jgi:hypothetical protein
VSIREPINSSDAAVVRRVTALFKAMSNDFLLREQFVTDPAQILFEYVYNARLDPEKASTNNLLIYSVMSSPRLLSWLRSYVRKYRSSPPAHLRLMKDFASAVVKNDADHVVLTLLRSSAEQPAIVDIANVIQVVFRSGIFVSDEPTDDATDISPTALSTDIGPTTLSTDIGPTTLSTDIGPTTLSTDIGPTTLSTDIGPTTLSTDISPTTLSTDISPTTQEFTSVGFGGQNFFGADFWGVSLGALAQYSTQLLNSGVLDEAGTAL